MSQESSTHYPDRGRPVHQPLLSTGNRSALVFLTVCTANRRPVLANPDMHNRLQETWRKANTWLVGRYVVMPDHIHLFCSPGTVPPESLTSWVGYWKRLVVFAAGGAFWQKNFWDTQLRRQDSYAGKWDYVRQNPVRAGLAAQPDEWPYKGELNVLQWHD